MRPRVSICMITYNHEKWIGEAIKSVLAQDFEDFEIVVGEDASTDGTPAIVAEYAAQDPRVRVLSREKNLGGRVNFAQTYGACRGEFINVLDGDDYFLNPAKLSSQVALLDAHPDLAGCFAGSQEVALDGTPLGDGKHPHKIKERYTLLDFARYCMSDSAAMLFRRGLFGELPELFYAAPQGDWPLHMLNALHGDFGYIPRIFSAYRIHADGVWNKKTAKDKVLANLECQRQFLLHLPPDTVGRIHPVIAKSVEKRWRKAIKAGEVEAAGALFDWLAEHCSGHLPWHKVLTGRLRLYLAQLGAPRG